MKPRNRITTTMIVSIMGKTAQTWPIPFFLEPLPAEAELPPRWEDSVRHLPPDPLGGVQ